MTDKPRGQWINWQWYQDTQHLGTQVHEQDRPPQTVIYDHNGNPYARARQPMGFNLSGRKESK